MHFLWMNSEAVQWGLTDIQPNELTSSHLWGILYETSHSITLDTEYELTTRAADESNMVIW